MRAREVYDVFFTENRGHIGFAPAVITLAIGVAVCASLLYGGVTLGKAAFAHAPTVETGRS